MAAMDSAVACNNCVPLQRRHKTHAEEAPGSRTQKVTIDVVEARAFVLVDEYGNPRAELSTLVGDGGKEGITIIQMNDDMGRARLVLQVDPTGTSIRLFDSNTISVFRWRSMMDMVAEFLFPTLRESVTSR